MRKQPMLKRFARVDYYAPLGGFWVVYDCGLIDWWGRVYSTSPSYCEWMVPGVNQDE